MSEAQDEAPDASAEKEGVSNIMSLNRKRKWERPGGPEGLKNLMAGHTPKVPPAPEYFHNMHGSTEVTGSNAPSLPKPLPNTLDEIRENAAAAVEKLNKDLVAQGVLKDPRVQDEASREILINDLPPKIRVKLAMRSTQEEIEEKTGAIVTTRGRFIAADKVPGRDTPLYLHVTTSSQLKDREHGYRARVVDAAVAIIEGMMGRKAQQPPKKQPLFEGINMPDFSKIPASAQPVAAIAPILHSSHALVGLHTAKVYLGFPPDPSFNVQAHLCGPDNEYLGHIERVTGASVTLRGRGSGNFEGPRGEELPEPPHLLLRCGSMEGLNDAKILAGNLTETVKRDYLHSKEGPGPLARHSTAGPEQFGGSSQYPHPLTSTNQGLIKWTPYAPYPTSSGMPPHAPQPPQPPHPHPSQLPPPLPSHAPPLLSQNAPPLLSSQPPPSYPSQAPLPQFSQAPPPHFFQAPSPHFSQGPPPLSSQAPPLLSSQAPPLLFSQAAPPYPSQAPPHHLSQAPPLLSSQPPPPYTSQPPPSHLSQAPPLLPSKVPPPRPPPGLPPSLQRKTPTSNSLSTVASTPGSQPGLLPPPQPPASHRPLLSSGSAYQQPLLTSDPPYQQPSLTSDSPYHQPLLTRDSSYHQPLLTSDSPYHRPLLTSDSPYHRPRPPPSQINPPPSQPYQTPAQHLHSDNSILHDGGVPPGLVNPSNDKREREQPWQETGAFTREPVSFQGTNVSTHMDMNPPSLYSAQQDKSRPSHSLPPTYSTQSTAQRPLSPSQPAAEPPLITQYSAHTGSTPWKPPPQLAYSSMPPPSYPGLIQPPNPPESPYPGHSTSLPPPHPQPSLTPQGFGLTPPSDLGSLQKAYVAPAAANPYQGYGAYEGLLSGVGKPSGVGSQGIASNGDRHAQLPSQHKQGRPFQDYLDGAPASSNQKSILDPPMQTTVDDRTGNQVSSWLPSQTATQVLQPGPYDHPILTPPTQPPSRAPPMSLAERCEPPQLKQGDGLLPLPYPRNS